VVAPSPIRSQSWTVPPKAASAMTASASMFLALKQKRQTRIVVPAAW
jgi:hypothetical protein